jgi:hypothetical protein
MPTRLLFAFLGAVACIVASLLAESSFARADLSQTLDDRIGRVLIFRSDIARRLEHAGGKSGDIQISLAWNGPNDLDLEVQDPFGEWVYYRHRKSKSGGELDVDANGGGPTTNEPVENVYWPFGRAPRGVYTIEVHHFADWGGGEPTHYRVVVLDHGNLHQFTGTIMPLERKTIYRLTTGDRATVLKGLASSLLRAMLVTGAWSMLLGALLSAALSGGQQLLWRRRYGRPLMPPRRLGKIVLCATGIGLLAGVCGQLLFSLLGYLYSTWPVLVGRIAGWALLGLIIGRGLAQWVPNLPRRAAAMAGALAGAIGACCFMAALGNGSDLLGRLYAAGLLGLMIGFLICLVIEPLDELDQEYLEPDPFVMQSFRLRANRGAAAGSLRGHRAPRNPHS